MAVRMANQITTRRGLRWKGKDQTTNGPCIADCASFNLLPIDIKGCDPSARLQLKLVASRSRQVQGSQGKNC